MSHRIDVNDHGFRFSEKRERQHPRQTFFDAVLRAIDVHLPGTPDDVRTAIATDAALFGETKGPG